MNITPLTIHVAAAAIANARINRRGSPSITNVLDILPHKLVEEVTEDATAALQAAAAVPEPGDVLENTDSHALARKIRVTEVTSTLLKADVLEGENTSEPLTVFRAGWHLYRKLSDDLSLRIRKFAKDPDVGTRAYALMRVGFDKGDAAELVMTHAIASLLLEFHNIKAQPPHAPGSEGTPHTSAPS